jgi:hypothetical protein
MGISKHTLPVPTQDCQLTFYNLVCGAVIVQNKTRQQYTQKNT